MQIKQILSSLVLGSLLFSVDSFAMRGRDGNEPKHPLAKKLGQSQNFRDTVRAIQNRKEIHVLVEDMDEDEAMQVMKGAMGLLSQNLGTPLHFWVVGAKKKDVDFANQKVASELGKLGIKTPPKFHLISELPISGKDQLESYLRSGGGSALFRHYYNAHTQSETGWGPRFHEFEGRLVPFNFFQF